MRKKITKKSYEEKLIKKNFKKKLIKKSSKVGDLINII
jgi:hypothetical protein